MLVDLGTNGEITVGNNERLVCASTAAGPAFKGGRISRGIRASRGAISQVRLENDHAVCHVLGGGTPVGLCGSGLVDAVAAGLDLGVISADGRIARPGATWPLSDPVSLVQRDVRELQLAKGAIAAGIEILLDRIGAALDDVQQVYLAGAFGNYVNRSSARRIGLLPFPADRIVAAGNTALRGAKIALFLSDIDATCTRLKDRAQHVPLAADLQFQDRFVAAIPFPADGTRSA